MGYGKWDTVIQLTRFPVRAGPLAVAVLVRLPNERAQDAAVQRRLAREAPMVGTRPRLPVVVEHRLLARAAREGRHALVAAGSQGLANRAGGRV